MRKRTLVATCIVALLASCVLLLLVTKGSADAQTPPATEETGQSCVYPINCQDNPAHPCCVRYACSDILTADGLCEIPPSLPPQKETAGRASSGGGAAPLTTTHYRNYRAHSCAARWQSSAGSIGYALPTGGDIVQSPSSSGYMQHVLCNFGDLPDNATLIRFCIYGNDGTSPGGHINGLLKRYDENLNNSYTNLASVSSAWSTPFGSCSSYFSEAVDNVDYNYFASVYISSGYSSNLQLFTVEVWYTTP
jgi:hypothetical protein